MSDQQIDALAQWIRTLHREPVSLDEETDLIDSGLVSSLQFVAMVRQIERLLDQRLSPDDMTMDGARTLRQIRTAFFSRPDIQPESA